MPKNDFFALRKRLRIPSQKRNFPKSAQLGRFLHYQAKKNPTEIVSTSVGLRGGATRNRTGDGDFADLCLTAWLWRHWVGMRWISKTNPFMKRRSGSVPSHEWSGKRGSNPPPQPWQGCALPNELLPQEPIALFWCGRRDLNPYAFRAPEPKSGASANSATPAQKGNHRQLSEKRIW